MKSVRIRLFIFISSSLSTEYFCQWKVYEIYAPPDSEFLSIMSKIFIHEGSSWRKLGDEVQTQGMIPPQSSKICLYKTNYQVKTFDAERAAMDFEFIWNSACNYLDNPSRQPHEINLIWSNCSRRPKNQVEFEFPPELSVKERTDYGALFLAGSRLPGYIFGKFDSPKQQNTSDANDPKETSRGVDAQTQTDMEPGLTSWYDKPTWILNRRIPSKNNKWIIPSCLFCRKNKESKFFSHSHIFRDKLTGEILCPVLRECICSICGATGKFSHTAEYCSVNPNRKIHVPPTPSAKVNGWVSYYAAAAASALI